MQVLYNKRINGVCRGFLVAGLGRYDEEVYREVKRRLKDWAYLERAPVLIREMEKGDF